MWRCRSQWRTPREPLCCSSESSSCSCRTWTPSPTTSTSPWSSTTMMTVRHVHASAKLNENQQESCTFLGLHRTVISTCSPFKVTPADYQPPGFREGESDSLWFEGVAVHFKVGEVQTAFHTLRVRVSAEQSRLEKLQEGNHLRETKQVSQKCSPEREMIKVGPERGIVSVLLRCSNLMPVCQLSICTWLQEPCKKISDEEDLPSEDGKSVFLLLTKMYYNVSKGLHCWLSFKQSLHSSRNLQDPWQRYSCTRGMFTYEYADYRKIKYILELLLIFMMKTWQVIIFCVSF